MNQPDDEIISVVELIIKDKKNKIIFKKFYKVPDYRDYSFQAKYLDRTLKFKFITSSCYSLPGYRNPDIACYSKLAEIAREAVPEYILCTGDIVYLEPLNISSKLAVQGAYDQLKSFEPIKNIWSNHTWICSNDDHELGYNDILADAPDIRTLRETMTENFPLNELTNVIGTRCGSFLSKNITWIILDDISNRVFNKNYTGIGYNKFLSALGNDQLLCLRNVCFFCGDSHQSDISEFIVNKDTNQIIREIRNSAIGSRPRNVPNDNPYQVPGSFVGGINNFGLVDVEGTEKNYDINYKVYTVDGVVYQYGWNSNY